MELVNEQDIINTYSEEEQFSCKKYFEYRELIEENQKLGYKKCAKLLGIKAGQVRWWHTKGEKEAIPLPLKKVKALKDNGIIPFPVQHKDCIKILILVSLTQLFCLTYT